MTSCLWAHVEDRAVPTDSVREALEAQRPGSESDPIPDLELEHAEPTDHGQDLMCIALVIPENDTAGITVPF